eukprot:Polyplicarium_translucidae@DN711_c0_g1_i1.p1
MNFKPAIVVCGGLLHMADLSFMICGHGRGEVSPHENEGLYAADAPTPYAAEPTAAESRRLTFGSDKFKTKRSIRREAPTTIRTERTEVLRLADRRNILHDKGNVEVKERLAHQIYAINTKGAASDAQMTWRKFADLRWDENARANLVKLACSLYGHDFGGTITTRIFRSLGIDNDVEVVQSLKELGVKPNTRHPLAGLNVHQPIPERIFLPAFASGAIGYCSNRREFRKAPSTITTETQRLCRATAIAMVLGQERKGQSKRPLLKTFVAGMTGLLQPVQDAEVDEVLLNADEKCEDLPMRRLMLRLAFAAERDHTLAETLSSSSDNGVQLATLIAMAHRKFYQLSEVERRGGRDVASLWKPCESAAKALFSNDPAAQKDLEDRFPIVPDKPHDAPKWIESRLNRHRLSVLDKIGAAVSLYARMYFQSPNVESTSSAQGVPCPQIVVPPPPQKAAEVHGDVWGHTMMETTPPGGTTSGPLTQMMETTPPGGTTSGPLTPDPTEEGPRPAGASLLFKMIRTEPFGKRLITRLEEVRDRYVKMVGDGPRQWELIGLVHDKARVAEMLSERVDATVVDRIRCSAGRLDESEIVTRLIDSGVRPTNTNGALRRFKFDLDLENDPIAQRMVLVSLASIAVPKRYSVLRKAARGTRPEGTISARLQAITRRAVMMTCINSDECNAYLPKFFEHLFKADPWTGSDVLTGFILRPEEARGERLVPEILSACLHGEANLPRLFSQLMTCRNVRVQAVGGILASLWNFARGARAFPWMEQETGKRDTAGQAGPCSKTALDFNPCEKEGHFRRAMRRFLTARAALLGSKKAANALKRQFGPIASLDPIARGKRMMRFGPFRLFRQAKAFAYFARVLLSRNAGAEVEEVEEFDAEEAAEEVATPRSPQLTPTRRANAERVSRSGVTRRIASRTLRSRSSRPTSSARQSRPTSSARQSRPTSSARQSRPTSSA